MLHEILKPLLEYFCFPFIPENGDSERERNLPKVMWLVNDRAGNPTQLQGHSARSLPIHLAKHMES